MRKKRRQKTDLKKILIPALAVATITVGAIALILHGTSDVGSNEKPKNYDADISTVFICDGGKIVTTDIEAFDAERYNQEELSTYVTGVIDTYNKKHGEGTVTKKKFAIDKGVATLIMEYVNTDVYNDFYGIELFSGTVGDALKQGYKFDVDFADVTGKKAESCDAKDITSQSKLKVAIIRANTRVEVDGEILYVSADNVYEYGKDYVISKDNYNIFELGVEESEGTETNTTEDSTESIMEDGVLVGTTEESTEIIFDFGDGEKDSEDEDASKTELAQTYIYIIYK